MQYYKSEDGLSYIVSPSEKTDLIEITKEEFDNHVNKIISYKERQKRIRLLKQDLVNTDYQAIKYAEGLISEEEYAAIKAQRQAWRDEINALEEAQNNETSRTI